MPWPPPKGKCPDAIKPYLWKKGQSGNPKGPKKRESFETLVAKELDLQVPGFDYTKREALAKVFVSSLLKNNGQMIKEFLAREWPVVQKHEVGMAALGSDTLEAAFDRVFGGEEETLPAKPNGNGAA